MRITGGECCGRRLKVPAGDKVRPTQDRVRSALFSMLADFIPGARVLDLFAGSGAVGFEALSRGAREAVWVEKDARTILVLKENLQALKLSGTAVTDEAMRWLKHAVQEPFDLVFADPPYEWAQEHGFGTLAGLLLEHGLLRPGGILVTEQPADLPAGELGGLELLRDREYGQTRLAVYRRPVAGGIDEDVGAAGTGQEVAGTL